MCSSLSPFFLFAFLVSKTARRLVRARDMNVEEHGGPPCMQHRYLHPVPSLSATRSSMSRRSGPSDIRGPTSALTSFLRVSLKRGGRFWTPPTDHTPSPPRSPLAGQKHPSGERKSVPSSSGGRWISRARCGIYISSGRGKQPCHAPAPTPGLSNACSASSSKRSTASSSIVDAIRRGRCLGGGRTTSAGSNKLQAWWGCRGKLDGQASQI